MELKQAVNGFIYTNNYGDVYIYSTLTELAAAVEGSPQGNFIVYAPGKSIVNLRQVRGLALNGEKISAIKELRNTFTPPLGLKETKEIVEVLCGLG
jgi:hypothetical protein